MTQWECGLACSQRLLDSRQLGTFRDVIAVEFCILLGEITHPESGLDIPSSRDGTWAVLFGAIGVPHKSCHRGMFLDGIYSTRYKKRWHVGADSSHDPQVPPTEMSKAAGATTHVPKFCFDRSLRSEPDHQQSTDGRVEPGDCPACEHLLLEDCSCERTGSPLSHWCCPTPSR